MSTLGVLLAIGITLVAVAMGIALRRMGSAWLGFRVQLIVTCPEDQHPAGVKVDAVHAALTGWDGAPHVRLLGCTRWSAKGTCGQPCLSQIEAAPQNCRVRSILARWYEGKSCSRCGTPVGEVYWAGSPPALLISGDGIKEWAQIPAEQLPATLETARPVCFHCYLTECASLHSLGATAP